MSTALQAELAALGAGVCFASFLIVAGVPAVVVTVVGLVLTASVGVAALVGRVRLTEEE